MSRSPAIALLLAVACNASHPRAPEGKLLYPTGLATEPGGQTLLVVSSDFDRSYEAAEVLRVPLAAFDSGDDTFPAVPPAMRVSIGTFAGSIALSLDGKQAFVPSRADGTLAGLSLSDPSTLTCLDHSSDCRTSAVPLGLADPAGVAVGTAQLPGAAAAEIVLVTETSPQIVSVGTGTFNTVAHAVGVAVPTAGTLGAPLFTAPIGDTGATTPIFDTARGLFYLPGCFVRTTTSLVQRCNPTNHGGFNPLRLFDPSAGSEGLVGTIDLYPALHGTEVTTGALSSDGATLFAVTRVPDALVELALPLLPSGVVTVRHSIALPAAPLALLPIRRSTGRDLLAIASVGNASVTIYDAESGLIAATIEGVGQQPSALALAPAADGHVRVVVSTFADCVLSAIDVPLETPWQSRRTARLVSGRAGTCPF